MVWASRDALTGAARPEQRVGYPDSVDVNKLQSGTNHPVTQVIDCPGIQLLRYHRGFTDAEHTAFLEAASKDMEIVHQGARFVMIIDVNKASQGSSLQRQRQAEWQERHTEYFKSHVICGVFVAGSAILRGALRAVSWLKPFPYPISIEADIEPAIITAQGPRGGRRGPAHRRRGRALATGVPMSDARVAVRVASVLLAAAATAEVPPPSPSFDTDELVQRRTVRDGASAAWGRDDQDDDHLARRRRTTPHAVADEHRAEAGLPGARRDPRLRHPAKSKAPPRRRLFEALRARAAREASSSSPGG